MSQDQGSDRFGLLFAIVADRELSAAAKCAATVLLLKFLNTKTGRCDPSFATLAEQLGRSRRAIITAVAELEKAGWLAIDGSGGGGRGNTNQFGFKLDRMNNERVKQTSPVQPTSPVKQNAERVKQTSHEPTRTNSALRAEEGEYTPARAPDGAALAEATFAEFWRSYPLQVDRKAALEAFSAALANGKATSHEIVAGAMRYAAERDGEDARFTARPANWLKRERWTDQAAPKSVARDRGHGQKRDPATAILDYANWSDRRVS